eukprot:2720407-Karenia_brevis.AAC.1
MPPKGPIGLLLQSTHNIAATLDLQNGVLRSFGSYDIHIHRHPWQQFKPLVADVAARALFRAETPTRSALR